MEASGLGGPMLGVVLLPGLLAAGIGSLIFIGLDSLTGLGTFSLALPGLPRLQPAHRGRVRLGDSDRAGRRPDRPRHPAAGTVPEARTQTGGPCSWSRWPGMAVAVLAIIYAEATGKPTSDVLFSGENALDPLITHAASYSVGALLLLMVCKGLAYAVSLSSFRGGPVFPAMFIGAAGGIALSHLPGLPLIAGVAMGIGAMSRGDAHPADHLGAARHPAARLRRPGPHATGDRGGGRRLRGRGQDHTGGDHRIGSPERPAATAGSDSDVVSR